MKMYNWLFLLLLCFCPLLLPAQKNMPLVSSLTKESNANWVFFKKGAAMTITELNTNKKLLGLSEQDQLKIQNQKQDELGFKHHRFQQYHQNIPIEGAEWVMHEKEGKIQKANGHLVPNLEINIKVTIDATNAIDKAKTYINAQKYAWEITTYEQMIRQIENNTEATFYPNPELVIVDKNLGKEGTKGDFQLAYKVDIFAVEPLTRKYVYVDAHNGTIITTINRLHDADTPCTSHAAYACEDAVQITGDYNGTEYFLKETGRGISTYNCQNSWAYLMTDFTSTDNHFDEDSVGTAIHWGTEQTYDYFLDKHDRNSYDDLGSTMQNFVHFGKNYTNAFWNGTCTAFGDGDDSLYTALSSLDIIGHEWTHAVIQYSSNLVYRGESGALNESFCDIFGKAIEFYATAHTSDDKCLVDWYIGGKVTPKYPHGMRNMADPNSALALTQQPDTYLGNYWQYSGEDNGGVHTNSGVQNYWFYLLVEGGSGTNDLGLDYRVESIGSAAAEAIVYRNLTVYLTPIAQYEDARMGSIQAAIDLYGEDSEELKQVIAAWCAVGVGPSDCSLNNSTITLITPNGKEMFQQGDVAIITWEHTGAIEEVKIEYSIDNGITWTTITEATPNISSYIWTIPNITSNLALIRVMDVADNSIKDESDEVFSIEACNLMANFIINPESICVGEEVYFTNTSSGEAISYEWKIDALSLANTTDFSYSFENNGEYMISLIASSGANCQVVYQETIMVNPAPTARFDYIDDGLHTQFIADFSTANAYTWDFGDGNMATGVKPIHKYTDVGTYTVCLTIKTDCGDRNSCTEIIPTAASCGLKTPEIAWQKIYGGSRVESAYDMNDTPDGGMVLIGKTNSQDGDVGSHAGESNYWVGKLNVVGELEWTSVVEVDNVGRYASITTTNDGGYIMASSIDVGDLNDDYLIIKLNATGQVEWEQTLGGSKDEYAKDILQTEDGGYLVTGITHSNDGAITNNHGGKDAWLVKLDNNGKMDWQQTVGGIGSDGLYKIEHTSDGGYIASGSTDFKDGYIINSDEVDLNGWLVKFKDNGQIDWQRTVGGSGNERFGDVKQTTDGGYIVGGYTTSPVDGQITCVNAWLIKFDELGQVDWQQTLGGSGYDEFNSVQQTLDGGYIVVGNSSSTDGNIIKPNGDFDIWILKLAANGQIQWQKAMGGSAYEASNTIRQTTDGGYMVFAHNQSTDGDIVPQEGVTVKERDFWVVKLLPDVEQNLSADFSITTNNCPTTSINITNTSIDTTSNTSYEWCIDGLLVANTTNLNYTFEKSGIYTISLIIRDGNCTSSHQKTITISPNADELDLGANIQECDNNNVLLAANISNMNAYNWIFEGNTIGTTASINANQSGTYILSVLDDCGNTAIDSINVLIDNDCVWPGDFNNDHMVNNYDLLDLGLSYGARGPMRPNASLIWEAQACTDWKGNYSPDRKHTDGDGNGLVDLNDLNALFANYGQSHDFIPTPTITTNLLSMHVASTYAESTEFYTTEIVFEIHLDNSSAANLGAYGSAFQLNCIIPEALNIHNVKIDFDKSWLGTTHEDLLTIAQEVNRTNNGFDIDIALSRIDHQNVVGSGGLIIVIAEIDVLPTIDVLSDVMVKLNDIQISYANSDIVGGQQAGDAGTRMSLENHTSNWDIAIICDGSRDECGVCNGRGTMIWYQDKDSDGLGNPNETRESCEQPLGFVMNSDDPDDTKANQNCLPFEAKTNIIHHIDRNTFDVIVDIEEAYPIYQITSDYPNTFNGIICSHSFGDGPFTVGEGFLYNIAPLDEPECAIVLEGKTDKERLPNCQINSIFPVPFSNELNIALQIYEKQDIELKFFDVTGRLITQSKQTIVAGEHILSLNLPDLVIGVYVLKINVDGMEYWHQIMK